MIVRKLVYKLPEWTASRWNRQVTQSLNEKQEFPTFKDFACNPIMSLHALYSSDSNPERKSPLSPKRNKATVLATHPVAHDGNQSSDENPNYRKAQTPWPFMTMTTWGKRQVKPRSCRNITQSNSRRLLLHINDDTSMGVKKPNEGETCLRPSWLPKWHYIYRPRSERWSWCRQLTSKAEVDCHEQKRHSHNDEYFISMSISGLHARGYSSAIQVNLLVTYTKDCIPVNRSHIPTCETAKQWESSCRNSWSNHWRTAG